MSCTATSSSLAGMAIADANFAGGSIMGKPYVDAAATTELLYVKPGKGTLALAGVALLLKEAKPHPASDCARAADEHCPASGNGDRGRARSHRAGL